MNANIFRHELRARLRSVLIWSLALMAMVVVFFSFYSAFADQAARVNDMMENFPQELRAAFGMDEVDLSTVLGFFSIIYLFAQLCLAIQAGNYGFGLVSIEESELTADFLLTRPVSRPQILTSKLLAAVISLLVTSLVVGLSSLVAIEMARGEHTYEPRTLALLLAALLVLELFFLCIGLVVSLLVKRVRSVTPYSLGLGFGAYVLSAFSGVFGDVELELITPFKHFDAAGIIRDGAWDTPLVLLNVGVTLVSVALSYWLYIRRDIPAVS